MRFPSQDPATRTRSDPSLLPRRWLQRMQEPKTQLLKKLIEGKAHRSLGPARDRMSPLNSLSPPDSQLNPESLPAQTTKIRPEALPARRRKDSGARAATSSSDTSSPWPTRPTSPCKRTLETTISFHASISLEVQVRVSHFSKRVATLVCLKAHVTAPVGATCCRPSILLRVTIQPRWITTGPTAVTVISCD